MTRPEPDDDLGAILSARGPAGVADALLATSRRLFGGTALVFSVDHGGASVLATDRVPPGLARATLLRGGVPALARIQGVEVVAPVRDDGVLGPLGRHADVAVVAPLAAVDGVHGVAVTLVDETPDEDTLARWAAHVPVAALALSGARSRERADAVDRRLDSLVTAVPDPLVVVDAAGRLRAVNPSAAEVLGLNPDFDIGNDAAARLRSDDLVALLVTPEGGSGDVTLPGAPPRVLHARVVPIRRHDGHPDGRVLTLEDVAARREAERVTSDLVAVIGHELRTPLTMIRGYASTLAKRGDDLRPAARARAVDALHDQANRLHQLVEDLLLVAGVERGRPELHLSAGDVRDVVARAVDRARPRHTGHRLTAELPTEPLVMPLDEVKLDQVLHHLLDNACKFSEDDSEVVVALRRADDGGCLVEVRDEGAGIFSGDQAGLFERFRQVDGTSTRRRGGTGVGLYICRRLVEAHGGRIGVRSALGRGSTFWFELPPQAPADDPDQEA